MSLVLALGLLLVFGLLWVNSRAGQTIVPQPSDVETALTALLEAGAQEQEEALRGRLQALGDLGWPEASLVAYLGLLSKEQARGQSTRPEADQGFLVQSQSAEVATTPVNDQVLPAELTSNHEMDRFLWHQVTSFASPAFAQLFQAGLTDQTAARQLLALSVTLLDFPDELTGQPEQVRELLGRMWPDVAPHAGFWAVFARAVDLAFPGQTILVADDRLARQIHQLRYLLSTYQADWVRRYYGGEGQSDRQALVAYLAQADARDRLGEWLGLSAYDYQLTYDLGESSRLHNKRGQAQASPSGGLVFPEAPGLLNLKILINYHSEFILTSQGQLANLMERSRTSANGILNGASFNYASQLGRRHLELDVAPVAGHDPAFRRRLVRGRGLRYRSPKSRRLPWGQDWEESFYNPKGAYALGGQSCYRAVMDFSRDLTREIEAARSRGF